MKKIHAINTMTFVFIGFSMFLTSLIYNGLTYAITHVLLLVLGATLVGLMVYFAPVKDTIKAVAYPAFSAGIASYLILARGNSIEDILIYIIAMGMASLYFDRKIFLTAVVIIFTAMATTYFVNVENFLDMRSGMYEVTLGALVFIGASILFYFAVFNGNKALMSAKESAHLSEKVSEELAHKVVTMEDTAKEIQSNVSDITDRMIETKKKSAIVELSIRDISDAVAAQANNVEDISHEVSYATEELIQTKNLADNVNRIKNTSTANIQEFHSDFESMNHAMKKIDLALNSASDIVNILNVNMEDVKNSLEGINRIASQTNLLALNASIESARAGEMGRGFAVVAEEIRKLSDETAHTVEKISTVIHTLFDSTKLATAEVNTGLVSVTEGQTLIESANNSLATVLTGFDAMGGSIQEETAKIQSISDMIEKINRRLQELTALSQEQASHSIIISDEMRKQQEEIEGVSNSVERLKMLSHTLDGAQMSVHEDYFTWNNNLSVDNDIIDSQHKQLLAIGQKLQDFSRKTDKTQKEFLQIVTELKDYTVFHFSKEEEMLKQCNYPDFDTHKAIHEKFIAEIVAIDFEKINLKDPAQLEKIMRMVSKWVLQHIANTDFKYSSHLVQCYSKK